MFLVMIPIVYKVTMPGPPKMVSEEYRKQQRAAYFKRRQSQMVYIGEAINDWSVIRNDSGPKTHEDVGKLLIER